MTRFVEEIVTEARLEAKGFALTIEYCTLKLSASKPGTAVISVIGITIVPLPESALVPDAKVTV